jgi:DNA-binding GntR family transcriptional regulator
VDVYAPTPVRPIPLWETVVGSLRRAIILGEFGPGMRLEEVSLAEKYGVSRVPIREALSRLVHEGLVRLQPHRGAYVVGVGEEDIGHVYECRRLIEEYAVRRTAERIDGSGLDRLSKLVDEMEIALHNGRRQLMGRPDVEFHRQIVAQSGNPRLVTAWEPLAGLIETILSITDGVVPDISSAVESHRLLVDAIRQHRTDQAQSLMRRHLDRGEAIMRGALRQMSDKTDEIAAAR